MAIEFMNKPKVVVTVSNKEVERSSCYEKDKKFYEKNIDCFLIKDHSAKGQQWYRVDSGKIGFNFDNQMWDLLFNLNDIPDLVEGIIDNENSKAYFSKKRNDIIVAYETYENKIPTFILNQEIAKQLGYIPCIWDELWYKKEGLSDKEFKHINTPQVKKYKHLAFDYNANAHNSAYKTILEEYKKADVKINTRTKDVSKYLYGTSFGVEIESSNGTLLARDLGRLGLVPLKDGSLRKPNGVEPYEYTTVPLSEAKGLETIKNICEELNKRCEFDINCSLHIHIGNIKWDRLTCLAYYILAQRIQKEIYQIVPMYKRDEIKYAGKQKCYNQPLPNIGIINNELYNKEYANDKEFQVAVKELFQPIIRHLTNNQLNSETGDYNLENANHPLGNQKWNIASRRN